jgi:serine/threonine protein phosphatase PrpC
MQVYSWGETDVGMKRDHNEDSYLVAADLELFLVADGMGGHAGGEMASGIAVKTVEKYVRERRELIEPKAEHTGAVKKNPVAKMLGDSIREACAAIYHKSIEVPELRGMGTTTTALVFHQKHVFIAHVGDSRAYVVRNGVPLQLSKDHSLVNEQLEAGLITEAQARKSRFKNIITRSVGFDTDVDVDVIIVEHKVGDVFLLCSDGLTGLVTDPEIADIICDNFLHRVPAILIDLANSRGGDDNITVVVTYLGDSQDVTWSEGNAAEKNIIGGAAYSLED